MIVKDVFFGETGPVPIPKTTGEVTPAPEADAPEAHNEKLLDPNQASDTQDTQGAQDQQDERQDKQDKRQDRQSPASTPAERTAEHTAEHTAERTERTAQARVVASHHRVRLVAMDDATWVVRLDQAILGYILRAGTVHVALRGATLNLAVEVGQSVSRARAFALLHSDWRVQAISR
jgi:hypothetical protein